MKKIYALLLFFLGTIICCSAQEAENTKPFKILILTERGGQHGEFTDVGMKWLDSFAKENNFEYTEVNNTERINEEFLSLYRVIIQLDFPPYTWTKDAESAFTKYIEEGKGGWVGFHHATLLGQFDEYSMWQWFSDFMGGVRFKNYIAPLATATVNVEDTLHPVMNGVNKSFIIPDDEWYTFDKSPRANVHVLASVDESTYTPSSDIKMGDHPAIWTNQKMKARNIYFLMGHSKTLFDSKDFINMFSNAILWASER